MLNEQDVCTLLQRGRIHELGSIPEASNDTRLVTVAYEGVILRAVFKPLAGERPLHDFPARTLGLREVASYLLCVRLQLPIVPPTVLRTDLSDGAGSLQAYVESAEGRRLTGLWAPEEVPPTWSPIFTALTSEDEEVVFAHAQDPDLRRQALFDAVTNNADRKASHILYGHYLVDGRAPEVFGIDNGLTFHEESKLRTVLWGFAQSPLLPSESAALQRMLDQRTQIEDDLGGLLSGAELRALFDRTARILEQGALPGVPAARSALPWPPL